MKDPFAEALKQAGLRGMHVKAFRGILFAFSIALAATLIAGALVRPASAGPAILIDASTGDVLFAHRAHDRWYPASVTKLMTAYLAFGAMREGRLAPDSPVLVTKNALAQPPSKMGFPVGTRLTLSSALKMLIVKSANDIAVAIGETVSGSEPAFVAAMNDTARRLGMAGTRFANPHGLHNASQYTTARDMAVLARTILREYPQYQSLFEIPGIKVGRRTLRSHNRLIGRYPGATGMKTGYICAGGYNLVASARRGNRHLIAVVLGAPNGSTRALVAAHMLENGFDRTRRFAGRGTSIESYRGSGRKPVNMRPHLCKPRSQRVPIPADVASFGFDVPRVVLASDDQQSQGSHDPMARRGAESIQVGTRGNSSRAERIARILASPRAAYTAVSANGLLPADTLAAMSMPTSIPLPRRRPIQTNRTQVIAAAVASSPAIASPFGSVPMPRRKPAN